MAWVRAGSRLLLGAVLAAANLGNANAQPAGRAPELLNWRYDEDWSYLSDPSARTGAWWEPLKYVPLGGSSYLSTGLEVRLRSELFRGNFWGSAEAPNDGYLLLRAIPHVDAHLSDHVRVFGQLIAADARGVEPSAGPADKTGVDVLQAFAEGRLPVTGDTNLTVRAGRKRAPGHASSEPWPRS